MKNYLEAVGDVIVRKWDQVGLSDFHGEDFTYAQIAGHFAKAHAMFSELGIEQGDRISICGHNSVRWALAFLSSATAHCVSVPILYDFTPENIMGLVNHSESSIIFTDKIKAAGFDTSKLPGVKAVIDIDDFTCLYAAKPEYENIINEYSKKEFEVRKEDVQYGGAMEDLTVINYTSGTTGIPKGIMLDCLSMSANVDFARKEIPVRENENSLSMLPMAHMYGLTFEFLYPFCCGSHVFFLGMAPTPTILKSVLQEVKPYVFITVPLVVEKLIKGGVLPVLNKPLMKILTYIPGINRVIYNAIGKKMKAFFGGNVRQMPVGGAPLNGEIEKVLCKIGIPYAIGYGMTECGPLISYVPWFKDYKRGSCGRELDGYNKVRIDPAVLPGEIGEIQVSGMVLMKGYYKNPEATAEAFTPDGWLRTGDLGIIDSKGNIFIRGRSKCMLLGSNGQNIYPEEIEAVINNMPYVSESVLLQRGSSLVALVTVLDTTLPEGHTFEQLMNANLPALNAKLPAYCKISKIEILEKFEHTPKGSIKRFLYS